MQTSNPAFNDNLLSHFDHAGLRSTTMTVTGTALKSFVLLGLIVTSAAWSYNEASNGDLGGGLLIGSAIGGMILGFITIMKPTIAGWTSPVYSVLEGIFLGAISQQVDLQFASRFPNQGSGIAIQAVALTGATLFAMLFLYTTRIIRVTQQLTTAIFAATAAIGLVYMVSILVNLFGGHMPYIHDSGMIGIGFSVFVVGLAAFNLLLDFDFIEKGAASGLPKSMEWYGAFGLMVTLVWLYLEVLRLLRKLQDRR